METGKVVFSDSSKDLISKEEVKNRYLGVKK